ncbi:hypothetical protein LCGC14_0739460 [marine sediment metagenome]|uniref:Uncharacterized protein n=1 Tax=marine sediment metagenome TaxID=412755 RepID=A0A0F9QBE9_9ZZZZ
MIKLRWYQTYDKNGVNSEVTLQYRDEKENEWEDVLFIREREEKYEEEPNDLL